MGEALPANGPGQPGDQVLHANGGPGRSWRLADHVDRGYIWGYVPERAARPISNASKGLIHRRQASSSKLQASSKPEPNSGSQASSDKRQAPGSKLQASSHKLQAQLS